MNRNNAGGAIPAVLGLLLALTGVAYGVLCLAISETRTVSANRHLAVANQGSKMGLVRGFRALDSLLGATARVPNGPIGGGVTPEGILYEADLRWLGREFFFLVGTGGSSGWPGSRRTGWVGWALDPLSRMDDMGGGIESGHRLEIGASAKVSFTGAHADPLGWPNDACLPFEAALDSLFLPGGPPIWAPIQPCDSASFSGTCLPGLGLLTGAELLARGWEDGRALPGPPTSPGQGCAGGSGGDLWAAQGSVALQGGDRCGVVLVDGNLTVETGGRLQGFALVSGDLVVEEGGAFHGMARVAGSATVAEGGELLVSLCAALRALSGASSLTRPILIADGHRINGF